MVEARAQVLSTDLSPAGSATMRLSSRSSTYGPFLSERLMLASPTFTTAADDHGVGGLAAAGLETQSRLAPRRLLAVLINCCWLGTFTTTVRVVDRVHGFTTNLRTPAHEAAAAGATVLDVLVLLVADGADGGLAVFVDQADF